MTQSDDILLACNITDQAAFEQRKLSIIELFKGATSTELTSSGYTFYFPSDGTWLSDLTTFIEVERHCCAFFQFDLRIPPHHAPLSLTISGASGVKAFLQQQFTALRGKA